MTTPMWEGYNPSGKAPVQSDYEQPPLTRDGRTINLDFLPGTLEQVRAEALAAYVISAEAERARLRAETYLRVDAIYEAVHDYVDMLEDTGLPGGMKVKIIRDGVEPSSSQKTDQFDGVLWPLVASPYNNNQEPHVAIGPDRRLYVSWMWDKDEKKKTYSRAAFAPLNLYDEADWHRINGIENALDKLEVPCESNLEMPPEGALHRNGAKLPDGVDLKSLRDKAMAAYNGEMDAETWAKIKPSVEQIDAIYDDARVLAELWRESGVPGTIKCRVLPDKFNARLPKKDQLIDVVMLPLYHSQETFIKDLPDYMVGSEGRIYNVQAFGLNPTTRIAEGYYYAPLNLYSDDEGNARRVPKIIEGLDNASKAAR